MVLYVELFGSYLLIFLAGFILLVVVTIYS
jgi:hypothetical protein